MNDYVSEIKIPRFTWKQNDLINLAYWVISILIWELTCHFVCYRGFSVSSLYIIPFSVLAALFFTLLTRLFNEKTNRTLTLVLTCLLLVIFSAQIVYHRVFGSFYSVKMIQLGGKAMARFWKETVMAIVYSLWKIAILAIPIPLWVYRMRHYPNSFSRRKKNLTLLLIGILVLFWAACVLSLRIGGTKRHSAYGAYHSSTIVTKETVSHLGMLTTIRLETGQLLFPDKDNSSDYALVVTRLPKVETEDTAAHDQQYGRNVTSIDFEDLDTYSYDQRVQALNNYLSYDKGTSKNRYTGYFEGYNLIEFCAESYSPVFVTEDLTPALYQLTHQGFIMSNYYTSFANTTTNCEYSLSTGLFPDMTRNKWDGSFIQSANNYLPYCLGNAFRAQGYSAFCFHNNAGNFYSREVTHPNMGYECYFEVEDPTTGEVGMTFSNDDDPTSDLEMIQQSLPIILEKGEPFVAYYMTYSGHYPYDFTMNPMSEKNRETVEAYLEEKGLEDSDAVKAYIACNLELEYALEYLMSELDSLGMLDHTAIVLTGDHYPYGLTHDQYYELAGETLEEPFGSMKNSFICWAGSMADSAPIVCDSYCSNIDILPTLLNLFGVNYDSRLLAGVDVFSDGPHMAILTDESFLTDVMMFDSTSNNITYFVDESLVPTNYYDSAVQIIQNKMNLSNLILYTNYYDLVFHPKTYDSPSVEANDKVSPGFIVLLVLLFIVVAVWIILQMRKAHRSRSRLLLDLIKKEKSQAEKDKRETTGAGKR